MLWHAFCHFINKRIWWWSKNPTQKKSGRGHGLGKLPKILRFPFNISATAEDSDFKFEMQLGFAKAYHKIIPRRKACLALGKAASQNVGFLFNISATAKVATSTSACNWGLPMLIAKLHPQEKVRHGRRLRQLLKFRVPFNISAMAKARDFKFGM